MTTAASKTFAKAERLALCDALDKLGPDAPTSTPAWTTADLAAYLWVRESDLIGSISMAAKPLGGVLDRRLSDVKQRWSYPELVMRLRAGPSRLSPFAIPGVDQAANTCEFFVRHEDVRRAAEPPLGPRTLDPTVEDWMWRRLTLFGRTWFKRAQVGVLLERAAPEPSEVDPAVIRVVPGATIVTLVGRPSELVLFAYGRTRTAAVEVVGETEAIETLYGTDLRR